MGLDGPSLSQRARIRPNEVPHRPDDQHDRARRSQHAVAHLPQQNRIEDRADHQRNSTHPDHKHPLARTKRNEQQADQHHGPNHARVEPVSIDRHQLQGSVGRRGRTQRREEVQAAVGRERLVRVLVGSNPAEQTDLAGPGDRPEVQCLAQPPTELFGPRPVFVDQIQLVRQIDTEVHLLHGGLYRAPGSRFLFRRFAYRRLAPCHGVQRERRTIQAEPVALTGNRVAEFQEERLVGVLAQ